VARRLSVVTCFYRTCVIDAVLDASPAAYVRRPPVPNESPTLGLSHLQFEAMIVAARTSANPFDFALVALLGLLGLRVFEACQADIWPWSRYQRQSGERLTMPSAIASAGRSCSIATGAGWIDTPPPDDSAVWRQRLACGCRGCIRTCCVTPT
jgi:hypothetical protein